MEHLLSLGWTAQLQTEYCLPEANHLSPARVVAVDRDSVLVAESIDHLQQPRRATLSGRLRHHGCEELAVGDWVGLHETRIAYVYKRHSEFVRKRAGTTSNTQVIATNVDLTLVLMSLNEDISVRRMERYVVAAWDAGTTPLVVLTKSDLVDDPMSFVHKLADASAGCEVVVCSALHNTGLQALAKKLLPGQTSVFVGSSGVGKSSVINALTGTESQSIATVRDGDAKGKHTTTRRELLLLPSTGALLIDTPGMREFGMASRMGASDMDLGFSDIEGLVGNCAFRDCAHDSEPGCAIQASIAKGDLNPERLKSYLKLLRELAYNERRSSSRRTLEEKQKWKKRSALYKERTKFSPKS